MGVGGGKSTECTVQQVKYVHNQNETHLHIQYVCIYVHTYIHVQLSRGPMLYVRTYVCTCVPWAYVQYIHTYVHEYNIE